jgi:hypothetical protein
MRDGGSDAVEQVSAGEQTRLQFEDFVTATTHPTMLQKSEVLVTAFQQADANGSNDTNQRELEVRACVYMHGGVHA